MTGFTASLLREFGIRNSVLHVLLDKNVKNTEAGSWGWRGSPAVDAALQRCLSIPSGENMGQRRVIKETEVEVFWSTVVLEKSAIPFPGSMWHLMNAWSNQHLKDP